MNFDTKVNPKSGEEKILLSDRVIISDPCYDIGTWCTGTLDNVLPGPYVVKYDMNESFGLRVSALAVIHEDYTSSEYEWEEIENAYIGVDSGECGIYDSKFFETIKSDKEIDKKFYDISSNYQFPDVYVVNASCVVSRSGYGDGGYPLYVARNNEGKVIGISVQYIFDDEDDDDEYYEVEEE